MQGGQAGSFVPALDRAILVEGPSRPGPGPVQRSGSRVWLVCMAVDCAYLVPCLPAGPPDGPHPRGGAGDIDRCATLALRAEPYARAQLPAVLRPRRRPIL